MGIFIMSASRDAFFLFPSMLFFVSSSSPVSYFSLFLFVFSLCPLHVCHFCYYLRRFLQVSAFLTLFPSPIVPLPPPFSTKRNRESLISCGLEILWCNWRMRSGRLDTLAIGHWPEAEIIIITSISLLWVTLWSGVHVVLVALGCHIVRLRYPDEVR